MQLSIAVCPPDQIMGSSTTLEGATMTGSTSAATLDTSLLEPALGPANPTGSGQEYNPHVVSIHYSL